MTDDEIVKVRIATFQAGGIDYCKPWGDSIAFARAILSASKDREALQRITELKGSLDYVAVQALSIANATIKD